MSDVVISVENLSKSYLIGHDGPQERYHSLRDTLVRHGKNYVRKAVDMARGRQIIQGDNVEEFWALKDVSFEVKRGEVLGIIGRNGAGKSTLLKILSRITEPTQGRVVLEGRVASLLEVGTGFHPELTGRENIFLNGAILGMTKVEIKQKFDEIVEFAEVERFLDTPVKRYSSGMYVRLAFAVAAHLEPEILVVDEVLAVGDAPFQKKCLGKMEDVARGGRTVLFVSHNMPAVANLCQRCIVMDQGCVRINADTDQALARYHMQNGDRGSRFNISLRPDISNKAQPYFLLTDFYLSTNNGMELCESLEANDNTKLAINIKGEVKKLDPRFNLGIAVYNESGECVIMSFSTDQPESCWPVYNLDRENHLQTYLDTSVLNEGTYSIFLLASLHCVKMLFSTHDDIGLQFTLYGNRGGSPYWTTKRASTLAPRISWCHLGIDSLI